MLNAYPAKILLFGEYTILQGSKALAIPYSSLSGRWSFRTDDLEISSSSRKNLIHFLKEKKGGLLDYDKLQEDLDHGIWFDSTIPQGFGLGSSGALIAALFDRYGTQTQNLIETKKKLTTLEDFFHGASSGIDPLVSFIQKPLLIHSFDSIEIIDSHLNLKNFFLLDTAQPRNTGPLVEIYQEKMKDSEFKSSCADVLSREVNFAIEDLLKNQLSKESLFHHLWLISKLQWDYFQEMIPEDFKKGWKQGLESGEFVLKLCGAGGGGFILGYSLSSDFKGKNYFPTTETISLN